MFLGVEDSRKCKNISRHGKVIEFGQSFWAWKSYGSEKMFLGMGSKREKVVEEGK